MSYSNQSDRAWEKLSQVAVHGAVYDSGERLPHPKCLNGTRVNLLKHIYGFLDSPEKNQLVWLHGTAGVGKSAVAFTVAERMRDLKASGETIVATRLAGTFFFSRTNTNRRTTGYFFATLAHQLARNFSCVRTEVSKAIVENPAILEPNSSLRDQMDALFLRPLRQLRQKRQNCSPLSFVIDALDECISQAELAELISLLGKALRESDLPKLHILLTSRSEAHVREAMEDEEVHPLVCEIPVKTSGDGVPDVISLDGADVDNDISIFLNHSFTNLRRRCPDFPQPTRDQRKQLATRAGRRFIVASTMMKFIDDGHNDPRGRLQLMIDLTSHLLPGTEVYRLYDRILSTCADPNRAYLHLSVVATLADPLPASQISKLLGPGQGNDVETTLVQLRSVMNIPTDSSLPVNIYHSSVRDYVSNPSNCSLPDLHYIAPHCLLAYSSLRLMIDEIPASTALLDGLVELKRHSKAISPVDPRDLRESLAFVVQPLEPLQVLSGLLWARGDHAPVLRCWLETRDGHAWLETEEGRDWLFNEAYYLGENRESWLRTVGGHCWLATGNGKGWLRYSKHWLQTKGGANWLQTQAGKSWLQSEDAKEWIKTDTRMWMPEAHTEVARNWLQTQAGKSWLQTEDAKESIETDTREEDEMPWVDTEAGRNWLQTRAGQSWLQTTDETHWLPYGGWLATQAGRDWLQTQAGKKWLQTEHAKRDWLLNTREGGDWLLNTREGGDWLQTQSGGDWMRIEYSEGAWMPIKEVQTEGEQDLVGTQDSVGMQDSLKSWSAEDWLNTNNGQGWLQNQAGRDWLQTRAAQTWLQTQAGRDWLQTQGGRDWLQGFYGIFWLQSQVEHGQLQTQNTRDWLQTQGGRDWLQRYSGRLWLQAQAGQDWLQTQTGRDWLQTRDVQYWLGTQGGKNWLQTECGGDWVQTQGGRDWLGTQGGQNWLQTESGRDWRQTQRGRDWLQTQSGTDWLQTQGGKEWLQTESGRDWLQTQSGRDWLQTQGGRDWLQTWGGEDWLQTESGRDWLQTPHAEAWPFMGVWVTIVEFWSALEELSKYPIVLDLPCLPAFQVIQHLKCLPDFLMFPLFLALRHHDNSTLASPQNHFPDVDIIHTMKAFVNVANKGRERSQSASDALKYACHNWAIHLARAPRPWDTMLGHTFDFFWNHNLLYWLEMQWCSKGLQACLTILYEGETLAGEYARMHISQTR